VSVESYALSRDSMCIDAGLDVSGPSYNGPLTDREGNPRPGGIVSRYDIGADEIR
jgi:hypothetical protein